jgi:hypothetical protein
MPVGWIVSIWNSRMQCSHDQDTAEDRILQARAEKHERTFLRELTDSGHDVCDLKSVTDPIRCSARGEESSDWSGRMATLEGQVVSGWVCRNPLASTRKISNFPLHSRASKL